MLLHRSYINLLAFGRTLIEILNLLNLIRGLKDLYNCYQLVRYSKIDIRIDFTKRKTSKRKFFVFKMKYALLCAFCYPRAPYGVPKIQKLLGTSKDIMMMTIFCKMKGILPENITILTDMAEVTKESIDCNVKYTAFPSSEFMCRELAQFVENTIRGIEDGYNKSGNEIPEVFVYFSCHGARINIKIPEERDEQAIILMDDEGTSLKYLTTKDIFNIMFGRIFISSSGMMRIPVYSKFKTLVPIEKGESKSYEEEITSEPSFIVVSLSPTVSSPQNSPGMSAKPYRSSYLANRGFPPWSKVLIVADACHSAQMTHFPFIYLSKEQELIPSPIQNTFVNNTDVPYCVCISSCDIDKTTKSETEGSQLTQIIFSQLKGVTESLNFRQFYYYIVNSNNSLFKWYLSSKTLTPVLSSTTNNVDSEIPFFSNKTTVRPKRITK